MIFVRFEFDLPTEKLRRELESGRLFFAMVDGGLLDWFILSSWCRRQGLGAVDIANRKRILFFAYPKAFFRVLFGRVGYAELFMSKHKAPRLICLSGRERKKLHVPTPTETLLSEVHATAVAEGSASSLVMIPVFILWRRHVRGESRALSEYLLGLSSKPNTIGKLWYLARRRHDSSVRALEPVAFAQKDSLDRLEGFDENESMRVAKGARRRVLVKVQQEIRVLLGPRYHSPSLIKETVLRDPEIQELISKLAKEQGIDRKKLMSRAYQLLTEIVADYRYRFVEVMYVVFSWLFSKVFDGMNTKDAQWQRVREVMKTKPVAFIPCHRSHFDYMVMPYLLFVHDMVTPHIAAGINLSFWPIGPFLRMGGAFFIRRSFRGDVLYQALLAKYVQTLLQHRYNLKFFIEGTRSRSGKMLPPAYGMLKMVMDTYSKGVCDDVALVPVSICYDEVPEQGTYSREIGGGQKVRENAWELIRSRKVIRRRFGKVYVRAAEPLLVSALVAAETQDTRRQLQKAAFQVSKAMCDATPITPKSILSTVLLCHRSPQLTLDEVLRAGQALGDYVQHGGMELSVEDPLILRPGIEQTLHRLKKSGSVLEVGNAPRRYTCELRKRTQLNFYKNNSIHCFVLPSIALLAYYYAWHHYRPNESTDFNSLFRDQALQLRDILKFEFFFNPRTAFLEELDHAARFYFDGKMEAGGLRNRFQEPVDASVFCRVLGELIESYLCFIDFVLLSSEQQWERKAMLSRAMRYAEARQYQGDIFFPVSISVVNYGNALKYLENQQLVEVSVQNDKTTFTLAKDTARLESILGLLSDYRDLMQERDETFF